MTQDQALRRFTAMIRRRRWSVGAVVLAATSVGAVIVLRLPSEYSAETVVRMDEGQVPKEYVNPTVTEVIADRLKAIQLELLQRPLLEEVAVQQGIVPKDHPDAGIEGFRAGFDVQVEGEDTFVLSYKDTTPERAAAVVNGVCDLFMKEHDDEQKGQAERTRALFDAKVESARSEYQRLQAAVDDFQREHYGALPDQLEPNMRNLEELQGDLNANQASLDLARDRKRALETQELDYLRHQEDVLADAYHLSETRYTEDQPEVVEARNEYLAVRDQRQKEESAMLAGGLTNPAVQETQQQIDQTTATLERLRTQQAQLRQAVNDTEANATALEKLTLDRDAKRQAYQDALAKDDEAGLAALEEQNVTAPGRFQVMEAAVPPGGPSAPDRPLLLGLVLGAALCLGIGAGLLHDALDTSLHDPEEVAALDPKLRLLAAVPHTRASGLANPRRA
jgi:uncharacterized protein involved in exopolysaccharide biosynthesis